MDIHTSVVIRITFQDLPLCKWELKLNSELLNFNNETNHVIISSQFQNTIHHTFPNHAKYIPMHLNPDTGILSAENYAIYEGVKLANTLEPNDILIISESLSTLLSLKKFCPKNKITSNIQACLIQISKNVEFMWVPSHIGIGGNEEVEIYVDQATKFFQNPTNSIPSTNKLKNVKKWNTPSNFNRCQDIEITRTRIGHSFFTHSYLISKEPQPICDACHIALTIKHIVEECTQYSSIRTDLNIPPDIAKALAEN
ncbi:hypothetical protein AGLY_012877 [Aphis glycines]|uniref:Uncharacterized protein n=1 Tax=Aphis glycines TaxID=307491 RepID=A0A6G0T7X9_APHGL|nr:hypothetical protein AGLY_012877 [Aphis glycines]